MSVRGIAARVPEPPRLLNKRVLRKDERTHEGAERMPPVVVRGAPGRMAP